MTLDKSYLDYPHRSEGMDHSLYPYSPLPSRSPVQWLDNKPTALWITLSLEFFPLTPNEGPRVPGHMVTPWPDLRTFTVRDYGNRVGAFRILDRLKERGLKASVPVSSALLKRAPALVDRVLQDGHELIALGDNMNDVHTGEISAADELARMEAARDAIKGVSGQHAAGWMSPGRFETKNTLEAAAKAGFLYHCDWVNDDMPYAMQTPGGAITAMPYTHELEDRHALTTLGQTLETWTGSVLDAAKLLHGEAIASGGGRVLHLGLTPYVIGQPFRIASLGPVLDQVLALYECWSATGAEIEQVWREAQA